MQRIAKVFYRQRHFPKLQPIRRHLYLGKHFQQGSPNEIELTAPVPLAGRKYLPSSDTPGFPKFLSGPRENYPLLIKAQNGEKTTITHWAERSRKVIDEAYRIFQKDGSAVAILFRGLPILNEKDFSEWVSALDYEPFSYFGGAGRRFDVAPNVTGGADMPKEFTIEPHNDMPYNDIYPKIFVISCLKTALRGGETAICDVRDVLPKLDPSFVKKCERKQIRYWHCRPDESDESYVSWQHQFQTKNRADVEDYMREKGYHFEWEGGTLLYWNNRGPFANHPISGERIWFNHVVQSHCTFHQYSPQYEGVKLPNNKYPFHATFGDGEELDRKMVDEVRRVLWENAVGFQWQDGDVLFLDQLIIQHSRLGYEGERKVGISLLTY